MAENRTIARPYAQAAYLHASAHQRLGEWSDMLGLLAAVAADDDMHRLLNSPRLGAQQLADIFIDIGADRIDAAAANFVRVLADNRRLAVLPDIAALFEIQRRTAEGTVQAEMITAYPASEEQRAQVVASLGKRLGRSVELTCSTDSSLIGGAIIRAGDLVIDGSVRGKLERLGTALNN